MAEYLQQCGNTATISGFTKYTKQAGISLHTLSIKAKLAKIGMSALYATMTFGITLLASFAVEKVVTGIDNLVHKTQQLKEASEQAQSSFKTVQDTLSQQKKFLQENSKEYAKLAQGINLLNSKNISLSTNDYERFLELNKELTELFPDIVQGYNDNNDVIVNLNGNVQGITNSLQNLYEVQKRLAHQQLATDIEPIYEEYYDTLQDNKSKYHKERLYNESLDKSFKIATESSRAFYGATKEQDALEKSLKQLGIKYTKHQVRDAKNNLATIIDADGYQVIKESYDKLKEESQFLLNDYKNTMQRQSNDINKYMMTYVQTDLNFSDLSEQLQTAVQQLFATIDYNIMPDEIKNKNNFSEVYDYYQKTYLYPLLKLQPEVQDKLSAIFSPQNSISNDAYIDLVNEVQQYFDANGIKINLDFVMQPNKDIKQRLSSALSQITNGTIYEMQGIMNYIDSKGYNTVDQLEEILSVIVNSTSGSDAMNKLIEFFNTFKELETVDLSKLSDELDVIQSAYQTVSKAISEYEDNNIVSLDTMQSLLELDDKYINILYDINGQLTLNTTAYKELTKAQLESIKVSIVSDAINTLHTLTDEQTAISYLEQNIRDLTEAKEEDIDATLEQMALELVKQENAGQSIVKQREAIIDFTKTTKNKLNIVNQAIADLFNNTDAFFGSNNADKFKQEIDWITNSLSNLNHELDILNESLNTDISFDATNTILNNVLNQQRQITNFYNKAIEEYKNIYDNALRGLGNTKYKTLIESNVTIDIEMFNNEDLFNKVSDAQKAWQTYQQALLDYQKVVKDTSDTQRNIYENKVSSLQSATTRKENNKQDIQNRIDLKESQGVDITIQDYQDLINANKQIIISQQIALGNAKAYRAEMLELYGKNSEAYTQADSDVQSLQDSIHDLKQEQIDYNKSLLLIPIAQLEKERKLLEDNLKLIQKTKDKVTSAINGASYIVQEQIDYYNEQKETTEKSYDEQIKAIQSKKDALQENNSVLEQQIALEKAQYNLERAKSQKTIKIFNGKEFVYEADQDAIRNAEAELEKERFNQTILNYETQINNIEKAKEKAIESLDTQLESLQLYKDQIDSIFESFENTLLLQELVSTFGVNIVKDIMNGEQGAIDTMKNRYIDIASQEYNTEEKINIYDDDIQAINDLVETWNASKETVQSVKNEITAILSNNQVEIKAVNDRTESVKKYTQEWNDSSERIDIILQEMIKEHEEVKEKEAEFLTERSDTYKAFGTTATSILNALRGNMSVIDVQSENIAENLSSAANSLDNIYSTKLAMEEMRLANITSSAGKSHSGMELGYIGEMSESQNKKDFKYLALSKLKSDEIVRVLQQGEAVLDTTQIMNVMDNFRRSFNLGMNYQPMLKNSNLGHSVVFNGDIIVQSTSNNVSDLAKEIKMKLPSAMSQVLFKNT